MASSLAEIDDQLSELGEVPQDVDAMVARYGDGDLSLSRVDALLAELEQGVQLASVASIAVTRDAQRAKPRGEAPSDEPPVAEAPSDEPPVAEAPSDEPPVAEAVSAVPPASSANHWDPDSALLDGPEWLRGAADPTDDATTGEVPIPGDRGGDSGELEAAAADGTGPEVQRHPSEVAARRVPRASRDTMVDSPSGGTGDGVAAGAAPITGEFMVDDGAPAVTAADDYLDDELDDILGGDEAGDDDVTMIASAAMVAKVAQPAESESDADDEFEDATGEENDSFEMLIDDEEIELIDEDELEVLEDEN